MPGGRNFAYGTSQAQLEAQLLVRQDDLAQEERNRGFKYTRERETIGLKWDTLGQEE